jgi:hypothetical protein
MTTDALAVGTGTVAEPGPYAPSWVNLLTGWIDRLPGSAWAFYVAFTVAAVALTNTVTWLSGVTRSPIDALQTYYAILLPAALWLIHHLDRVAPSALDAFRPALVVADAELSRWRYELTIAPARPATLLTVLAFVATLAWYLTDPIGAQTNLLSPIALVIRLAYEGASVAVILILLYHTLRQLRLVPRIHARATRINLLQPGPLYAFSRLTAHTAIGLMLMQVPAIFITPTDRPSAAAISGAWYAAITVVVVLAFAVPLAGMHRQIAVEKNRLLVEVGRRIESIIATLHRSVDDREISQADKLNDALTSLIAERDLLKRLPTWPWEPGTIGAVASAVLLPIGLWLITRALERVLWRR